MANIKDLLKTPQYETVKSTLDIAGSLGEQEGKEIYVVGGFVRDLLMGKSINDIDLMTVGEGCLLYTSPSPRDRSLSRMPSSA